MKKLFAATPILSIVLWASTVFAVVVHAEQDPSEKAQAVQGLNNDGLKTMLTNMGYEPKPLSKGFLISQKLDTWTVNMQVVLSGNLGKIGMNANLGQIEKLEDIPSDKWLALLVSNGDVDPSAFYVDRQQKKLYLHRSIDNRAITPAFLREQIDAFCGNVKSTAELWKFTK